MPNPSVEDRVLIVSGDSHAGPTTEVARSYFAAKYEDDLLRYESESKHYVEFVNFFLIGARTPEDMIVMDPDGAIASGGEQGAYDPDRRLEEMNREGIAAEVLIPQHQLALTPFFGVANNPYPAELRAAGTTAYHRWLVDHVSTDPKRLLAVAEPGPCTDMEAAVRELRWTAEHGFVAAQVPRILADPELPPLYDPYYETYWSTCAEFGIPLLIHVGYGRPQGELLDFATKIVELVGTEQQDGGGTSKAFEEFVHSAESPFAPDPVPRQAIWQMMFGGVFDRYPDLKVVATELRADWIPTTLAALDRRFERGDTPLRMKPSEYWSRNFFVCPSSIHRAEVLMRDDIGITHMLFGRDYPHPEGTWPNTWNWIRDAFAGVPETDVRMILGENAIKCFGLDREALSRIAQEIGPRSSDLFGDAAFVNPALLDTFDSRAAYRRPAEDVNLSDLDRRLAEDLEGLAKLSG